MSKAKIRIEYNGKTYRVGKSNNCANKRDCDLFQRGVCDKSSVWECPCDAINDAFHDICGAIPKRCFKEVKRK